MEDEQTGETSGQRRRMLSRQVAGWIGVVAGLAGILAAVFFIKDRYFPPHFTLTKWTTRANSVCDEHYTDLMSAMNKSNESMGTLLSAADKIGKPSAPTSDELNTLLYAAADDLDVLVGRERGIGQDFDRIERPVGHQKEVDVLILDIHQVSQMDADFAQDTRDAVSRSGNGKTYKEYSDQRIKRIGQVRKDLQGLGVTKCLS